jgi:CelD/BcsL family acetyltransferase involved in cellulose biosynthesis
MFAQWAKRLSANSHIAPAGLRSAATDLTHEVFTSFSRVAPLFEAWDAFVRKVSGPLFQSSDWTRIWWTHYANGRELRLLVFRVRGDLVGLVPLCTEQMGFWPFNLKVAKLLSSDSTLAYCDPPVDPAWANEIYQVCLRLMLEDERCDAIHFGPISGSYNGLEGLRTACTALRHVAVVSRYHQTADHMTFDLRQGSSGAISSLSSNQRGNYRRNLNSLTKRFRFRVDVVSGGEEAATEFENFISMHRMQWQAVNRLGHFDDWPGSSEFHRDLVSNYAKGRTLRLVRLIANEFVIAYYYCIQFGGTYYWLLPARRIGQDWDRFGLGRVGLIKMLEVATSEGVWKVEAGPGRYKYKAQLNGIACPLLSKFVTSNRPLSRVRGRIALLIAQAMHEVYYRRWFLRSAPHLPFRKKGLHPLWIRTRF